MWNYEKRLEFPISIKNKDLRMAKIILTQLGGPNGELAAAIRYLSQRYTMPTDKGKALLTDIGTEELSHVEMISTMAYQLIKDATVEEIKEAGLADYYSDHAKGIFPVNASGELFSAAYFSVVGDPVADLTEDLAAEQKARAVYENLIDLTRDPDLLAPLTFLREREVIHYNRFLEYLQELEGMQLKRD